MTIVTLSESPLKQAVEHILNSIGVQATVVVTGDVANVYAGSSIIGHEVSGHIDCDIQQMIANILTHLYPQNNIGLHVAKLIHQIRARGGEINVQFRDSEQRVLVHIILCENGAPVVGHTLQASLVEGVFSPLTFDEFMEVLQQYPVVPISVD